MTTQIRVPEGSLCDHCKNSESPLMESNSQHLWQRDWEGKEITSANVHRECAEAWAHEHGGAIVPDEPLPPRPSDVEPKKG
jgi:hypothetical protein